MSAQKAVQKSSGCYRSVRTPGPCANCGRHRSTVHVPTRVVGIYCGACCVVCRKQLGPPVLPVVATARQGMAVSR